MKKREIILSADLSEYLETHADRLGFKDGKSLVHYLCAIVEKMATRMITVTDIDNHPKTFTPTPKMLKDEK